MGIKHIIEVRFYPLPSFEDTLGIEAAFKMHYIIIYLKILLFIEKIFEESNLLIDF